MRYPGGCVLLYRTIGQLNRNDIKYHDEFEGIRQLVNVQCVFSFERLQVKQYRLRKQLIWNQTRIILRYFLLNDYELTGFGLNQ